MEAATGYPSENPSAIRRFFGVRRQQPIASASAWIGRIDIARRQRFCRQRIASGFAYSRRFLAIYTGQQVIGMIGEVSPERHRRVLKQLSEFLVSTKPPA